MLGEYNARPRQPGLSEIRVIVIKPSECNALSRQEGLGYVRSKEQPSEYDIFYPKGITVYFVFIPSPSFVTLNFCRFAFSFKIALRFPNTETGTL